MYRSCLAIGLLMLGADASSQSVDPNASRAFPGAFGFAIGERVDPARLQAAGFVQHRSGPVMAWVRERPDAFFAHVAITPMPGELIGMMYASAPMLRPEGAADSPAMRDALLERCQAARAALIESSFAGYYQRDVNPAQTYIAERVEPGEQIAANGASRAILSCLEDSESGQTFLTISLSRSDF